MMNRKIVGRIAVMASVVVVAVGTTSTAQAKIPEEQKFGTFRLMLDGGVFNGEYVLEPADWYRGSLRFWGEARDTKVDGNRVFVNAKVEQDPDSRRIYTSQGDGPAIRIDEFVYPKHAKFVRQAIIRVCVDKKPAPVCKDTGWIRR